MPTTLSQLNIVNSALSRIGVKPLTDIEATDDVPAEQARNAWAVCFPEVARAHGWSCLTKPVVLAEVAQTPIVAGDPIPASTDWAPATAYAVGAYVTFGSPAYLYECLVANTSTASFTNDLTAGFWFQTDLLDQSPLGDCPGANYASGFGYSFQLPDDCLLVTEFNGEGCPNGTLPVFRIMGTLLYTNETSAVIKYVWQDPDTTHYDTLLVGALTFRLAAELATMLRQDDTQISTKMFTLYDIAVRRARTKDSGEGVRERFDQVANSRLVGSRYGSTNR